VVDAEGCGWLWLRGPGVDHDLYNEVTFSTTLTRDEPTHDRQDAFSLRDYRQARQRRGGGGVSGRGHSRSHRPVISLVLRIAYLLPTALIFLACSAEPAGEGTPLQSKPSRATSIAELQALVSTDWVSVYDPDRAWSGYTLDLYNRRIPILFDMNGRIAHAWPETRVKARARLLPNGSLLAIGLDRTIEEYDWDGKLVWQAKVEGKVPHHDVGRLGNGNTVVIIATKGVPTDDIVEFDRHGKVVWEWKAAEHLSFYWTDREIDRSDITHINSVKELPNNRWWDAGDERFRPGNLLISARNLDAVFIIDKASKEIVWSYDIRLDRQHEAVMTESGLPGEGNILIFNNGLQDKYRMRSSTVIEIDPTTLATLWEYRSDTFFSQTGGVEQALPNGNVMITSSLGGRIFEVTRDGDMVWEWTPAYKPMRPNRYSYDFCPQLESMGRPEELWVEDDPDYRHVDRPLYLFARKAALHTIPIQGEDRKVLKDSSACRDILIPAEASLRLTFFLDTDEIEHAGLGETSGRFRASLRPSGSSEEIEILNEVVSQPTSKPRHRTVNLEDWAYKRATLCIEADRYGRWQNPDIRTARARVDTASSNKLRIEMTEEELRVRLEHLEALGYVE